jgi:hypothetical protein
MALTRWTTTIYSFLFLHSFTMKVFQLIQCILKFLSLTGISCLKIDNGSLQVAKHTFVITIVKLVSISFLSLYILTRVDLSTYLRDGQQLSDFSPFTIAIFVGIGLSNTISFCFLTIANLVQTGKILKFARNLLRIYEKFVPFYQNFAKHSQTCCVVTILHILFFKALELILLCDYRNLWVAIAYFSKVYCEIVVDSFLLFYIIYIKYMTFLLACLNYRLKIFVTVNAHAFELDEIAKFYQVICSTMDNFNEIFQYQVTYFICYMTARLVVMVKRNNNNINFFSPLALLKIKKIK